MRPARPWLRKSTGTWHVQLDGKQRYLGKDEAEAQEKYRRLCQVGVTGDKTVRQIVEAYWKWCKANLADSTLKRRKPILESFSAAMRPTLKADAIRAFHVQDWLDANDKKKAPVKKRQTRRESRQQEKA